MRWTIRRTAASWRSRREQIASAIAIGHRLGWQMVAHVTGDAGVDAVLDGDRSGQSSSPAATGGTR